MAERLMSYSEYLRMPTDAESAKAVLESGHEGAFHCFAEGRTREDHPAGVMRYWDFFRTDEEASPNQPAKTRFRVFENADIQRL